MQNVSTYFLWPIAVGIIILLIEYFVIQPLRKANDILIPAAVGRDWATAIKVAVKKFKSQQSGYNWFWLSPQRNTVTLDEWEIQKGQATITLSVYQRIETWENPVPGLAHLVTIPRLVAKYQLIIDRTGEIRKLTSVSFSNSSQNRNSTRTTSDLPPTSLAIKNRKVKTEKVVNNGVKVVVEFDIVNSGKSGKACPYVEYKVVRVNQTFDYIPDKVFTKPTTYEVDDLGTLAIRFENVFYPPELPLVDSMDKIKIELYPCPKS